MVVGVWIKKIGIDIWIFILQLLMVVGVWIKKIGMDIIVDGTVIKYRLLNNFSVYDDPCIVVA